LTVAENRFNVSRYLFRITTDTRLNVTLMSLNVYRIQVTPYNNTFITRLQGHSHRLHLG